MLNNNFIRNTGSSQTLVRNNNKHYLTQSKWDTDYDGNVAHVSLDSNENGVHSQYKFTLDNDDLANLLNVESVDIPIHERLNMDFKQNRPRQQRLQHNHPMPVPMIELPPLPLQMPPKPLIMENPEPMPLITENPLLPMHIPPLPIQMEPPIQMPVSQVIANRAPNEAYVISFSTKPRRNKAYTIHRAHTRSKKPNFKSRTKSKSKRRLGSRKRV